jgi:hypothetical protein
LGRNRCPNCGKRVPEYKLCCPRCGHSIPVALGDSEDRIDPALDDGDEWIEEGDEGIDDPGLLEAAEAAVRALPLKQLAGLAGTYKYTSAPDFTKVRAPTTVDEDSPADEETEAGEDSDRNEDAVDEDLAAEEMAEPVTLGGACPACGRQAQKGWKTCPWCGSALPV